MEDNRKEQAEALEALKDYNPKVLKALKEVIPEITEDRKEDTQEYLDYIFKGINWEFQVINGTLELLNEKEEQISKETLNEIVTQINDAYTSNDDSKLEQVMKEDLLPFIEKLDGYIERALA